MQYKKVTLEDIEYFKSIIPESRISVGSEISSDYCHDELNSINRLPEILIKVASTDEVSKITAYANSSRIPIVVRGSGTGLVGGAVSINGGIMLDTTLMNKIKELDTENLTITVEPGILLMDLSKFVEQNDLFYPPDPGEKSATIGGNISTNAGGMRAVKYGVTRDYVRALTVVLASGEIINLGGKVAKNSSGYSLKDLIIGSEGTLGIITEAVLKLIPMPKVSISLLIPFPNMDTAIESVPEIIKSKAAPTAIEFMERETILFAENYLGKKFPDTKSEAYILLTFDGNSVSQVETEYEKVADICIKNGANDVFIVDTEERKQAVWSARGSFLEAIKASTTQIDECDVVVPKNRVAEFIKYSHRISKELAVRIPSFGHAGDGNLHIYICKDNLSDEIWKERLQKTFDLLYKKAAEMGGLVSGEHGIGYAKKVYMLRQYGESHVKLMAGIKAVFDPNNILNPGKICT